MIYTLMKLNRCKVPSYYQNLFHNALFWGNILPVILCIDYINGEYYKLPSETSVDFSELEAERKELYDERTLVGREVKQVEGSIKGMETYSDAPSEKIYVSSLLEDLADIQAVNRKNDKKKEELEALHKSLRLPTKWAEIEKSLDLLDSGIPLTNRVSN